MISLLLIPRALAQEPETIPEALEAGSRLIEAFQTGNWMLVTSLSLMLLIFLVRKFVWKSIPKKWIPRVAIAAGFLVQLAAALAGGGDPVVAVFSGITMGLAAIGGWEAIKNLGLVPKKSKDEYEGEPETEEKYGSPHS